MIIGKAKDIVRAWIGLGDLSSVTLYEYLTQALLDIETEMNGYWMGDKVDGVLTPPVTTAIALSATPFSIAKYKDVKQVKVKFAGSNTLENLLSDDEDSLDNQYQTNSSGSVEAYALVWNASSSKWSIKFYPLTINTADTIRIYYYKFTTLSLSNLDTHELLDKFPYVLINKAVAIGVEAGTHSQDLVGPWMAKYEMELKKLKKYNSSVQQLDKISLIPHTGPGDNDVRQLKSGWIR